MVCFLNSVKFFQLIHLNFSWEMECLKFCNFFFLIQIFFPFIKISNIFPVLISLQFYSFLSNFILSILLSLKKVVMYESIVNFLKNHLLVVNFIAFFFLCYICLLSFYFGSFLHSSSKFFIKRLGLLWFSLSFEFCCQYNPLVLKQEMPLSTA